MGLRNRSGDQAIGCDTHILVHKAFNVADGLGAQGHGHSLQDVGALVDVLCAVVLECGRGGEGVRRGGCTRDGGAVQAASAATEAPYLQRSTKPREKLIQLVRRV